MKKQAVVRTYPDTYTNPTSTLKNYLSRGYKVVMVNPFDLANDKKGNEYILEIDESEISE